MLNDKAYINEIDAKKHELQKERYKIQTTKPELNRTLRHDSRFDLFYENIKNAVVSLPIPEFNDIKISEKSNKEYVLGCGDFHYGASFTSANNTYSRENG